MTRNRVPRLGHHVQDPEMQLYRRDRHSQAVTKRGVMMDIVYFAGSAAAGIIGWMTIFAAIIWPKMKQQPRVQQLKTLTAIHFFRYFATTLLIAGLVSRKLPSGFADPAAFGDLISLGLAYIAFIGLCGAPKTGQPLLLPVWILTLSAQQTCSWQWSWGPRSFMILETSALPTLSRPCMCRCCWSPTSTA